MSDSGSAGKQSKDFGRETLQLSKDLERITEQMENVSGSMHGLRILKLGLVLCK